MADNGATRNGQGLELPALGVCIASGQMDPAELTKLREKYGDGLAVVNGARIRYIDPARLLVMERSTWDKIPETIKNKLRAAYKWGDGLRVFPDGFLSIVDTVHYPTSQQGTAALFCDLRGGGYVHSANPAAGYYWETLETTGETTGGYWKRDENDTRLRAELDKIAWELWEIGLALRPLDDADSGGKGQGRDKKKKEDQTDNATEDPEEQARNIRTDCLKRWRAIVRDRYDSLANYELDRILVRVKNNKDKEGIIINDPAKLSHLLPCLNGTYDLEKHVFRSSRPDDCAAYFAPTVYDKAAEDADAAAALEVFFDGKSELIRYFWQLVGTALDPSKRKDTKMMVQLVGKKPITGKQRS